MSQCVITGCAFVMNDLSAWGDLHEEGDCWIFNANRTPEKKTIGDDEIENIPGETRWQDSLPPKDIKTITFFGAFKPPFEMRGVIVASKILCELNAAAKEYVK